uniref:PRC-barrel domain-containing protein n=1 Tax=Klebsiella pneumoniae TaxID=573 RepID=UPI0021C3185B
RKVTLPTTGSLADLEVVSADGTPVGSIAGVVIEAAARKVRYYDVRSSGWLHRKRRFIDAAELAQVDAEGKRLRLLTPDPEAASSDLGDVREFS